MVAFVQPGSNTNSAAGGTIVVTPAAAMTNGNTVVVHVTSDDGGGASTTCTLKDNNNVSYTAIDTVHDTTNTTMFYSFRSPTGGVAGSPTSLTATFAGTPSFRGIVMEEWSGVDTSAAPVDGHNMATKATSTTPTSNSITTTVNGDLIIGGVVADSGGSTIAAGSGYTLRNHPTGPDIGDESQVQITAGAITASFVFGTSQASIVSIIAFKAAVAVGAVPALSRPIMFRPYQQAPFLNRLPPTTSPPPIIPTGVVVRLSGPVRFKPFAKAPFLNKLQPVSPAFSSGNVTSSPGFGSLTLIGLPPSLASRVFSGFASITLNGQAPSLHATVAAGFGSLILTGPAPKLAFVDHPGFGSIVLTGFAPTASITSGQTVLPGIGQLILTGLAPSLAEKVFPTTGAILLTGKAPSLALVDHPGFGSVVLTGLAPAVSQFPSTVLPGFGNLLLTGRQPTVSQSGGGAAVFQTISSLPGFFNPNASAIP